MSWRSSDEKVAKVDENGKIIAIAEGKAIITVTTKDGGFTASCEITVLPKGEDIKVTGVSLDKTSSELKVDEELKLIASILPEDATNKEVSWISSDEKVAKVDENGKVTAIAEGKSVITVTTKDGGFTASCEITVLPNDKDNGSGEGINLPETGGNNPTYILIIAILVVGVGAFLFLKNKKSKENNNK